MPKLRSVLAASCAAGLLAACTAAPPAAVRSSPSPPATATGSPTQAAGSGPLVAALPTGCDQATPDTGATVAFVAGGRAWAVTPDGSGLTCLFETSDPGPFAWGPRADRVLLGGLEVRSVTPSGDGAVRPAGDLVPTSFSWGRPVGKAVAFTTGGPRLQKAIAGSDAIADVTPQDLDVDAITHVAYHPSGLALGFVADGPGGSAIWMASNTGADARRTVFSTMGTRFGPLAFAGSTELLYGARLKDGRQLVIGFDLSKGEPNGRQWVGMPEVLSLLPSRSGARMLLDVGSGCADRQALFSKLDGTAGVALLPHAAGPTTALGWIDGQRALVGEGGCQGPMRLWIVNTAVASPSILVVEGADRGAVRLPAPTPAPAFPDIGVDAGFG